MKYKLLIMKTRGILVWPVTPPALAAVSEPYAAAADVAVEVF